MNFNSIVYKSFRVLLLPFALIYAIIVIIRNWMYDKKYFQSAQFNFPLICVGNLSVGGTGKSPMVEYLVDLLKDEFQVATLSRGYKRKTKGYALASETATALEIGDEPMQFHIKFPDVAVAVGEERIVAIPQLLHDKPNTQAIILDDAFQHREVVPEFNILLTEYNNLFTDDFFLPTGDLRDQRSSYKRAQVIIVTKCPNDISEKEKAETIKKIKPLAHQKIFFTSIEYGQPYHILNRTRKSISPNDEILLVCGIANPKPLKEYVHEQSSTYYQMTYNDHHIFSIDDLKDIQKRYDQMQAENKFILTTEKDAVRLMKFQDELREMNLYVIPIQPKFLFGEEENFNKIVVDFIKNFTFEPDEKA
jgi:tetraacyldisaccharide 4'-kinase